MGMPAFETKYVPIGLFLCLLLIFEHFDEVFVGIQLLLVDVARVVAMDFPDGEAEPAEFVIAFLADHAVASLVFFDGSATIWTSLGVGLDPEYIRALVCFLRGLRSHLLARARLVILCSTLEAEGLAAKTLDDIIHTKVAKLYDILARFLRTPFHVLIQVRKLFTMPILIFVEVVDAVLVLLVLEIF